MIGGSCDADQESMGTFQECPQVGSNDSKSLDSLSFNGYCHQTFTLNLLLPAKKNQNMLRS